MNRRSTTCRTKRKTINEQMKELIDAEPYDFSTKGKEVKT